MLTCPACALEQPPGQRVCAGCQTPLTVHCRCGADMPAEFAFCGRCGSALEGADAAAHAAAPHDGDRRLLTVMFCDLVGSTTLSEKLDPEDLQNVVRACQAVWVEIVERLGGYVAQYLGDGMLVYFGYEEAREDDAWRTVRAGLEVVSATRFVDPGADLGGAALSVRVGVHTGAVVTGEMGAGRKTEALAMGMTPNVAARIQGLAAPDSVLISGATHRLLRGRFVCEPLGPQHLKGLSRELDVFRVVDEARQAVEAPKTDRAAVVGRTAERRLLADEFGRVARGESRALLLTGEAGVGKSRLVDALRDDAVSAGGTVVIGSCSSLGANTPLEPVASLLARMAGFQRGDQPAQRVERLEAMVRRFGGDLERSVPSLAPLLGLPLPPAYPPLRLSPQRHKQRLLRTLLELFASMAASAATVLVVEDLHWADPSTLELLGEVLQGGPPAGLLLVLTARPEFEPPWPEAQGMERVRLRRLSAADAGALVREIAGDRALDDRTVARVIELTEGIPLYVAELTRSVLDADASAAGRPERGDAGGAVELPDTLQGMLRARLDSVGPARPVAQFASMFGRRFRTDLLARSLQIPADGLVPHLARLQTAELIVPAGDDAPGQEFAFRHALLQEAAYQSVKHGQQRRFHRRIAQAIEEAFPDLAAVQPQEVGRHWARANEPSRAMPYLADAGDRARAAYANVEALGLYDEARAQARAILQGGDTVGGDALIAFAGLLERVGDVHLSVGEFLPARTELRSALAQLVGKDPVWTARLYRKLADVLQAEHEIDQALASLTLAEQAIGPEPETDRAAWLEESLQIRLNRMIAYYWKADLDAMGRLAAELEGPVAEHGTPSLRSRFYTMLYALSLRRERYAPSDATLEYARSVHSACEEGGDLSELTRARFNLAIVLFFRGDHAAAGELLESMAALARRVGEPPSEAICAAYQGLLARVQRDVPGTIERSAVGRELTGALEMHEYLGLCCANLGWAAWKEGRVDDAVELGHAALAEWDRPRTAYPFQWTACLPLAAIALEGNRPAEAAPLLRRVLDPAQQRLPDRTTAALEAAVAALDAGGGAGAEQRLAESLAQAGRDALL